MSGFKGHVKFTARRASVWAYRSRRHERDEKEIKVLQDVAAVTDVTRFMYYRVAKHLVEDLLSIICQCSAWRWFFTVPAMPPQNFLR